MQRSAFAIAIKTKKEVQTVKQGSIQGLSYKWTPLFIFAPTSFSLHKNCAWRCQSMLVASWRPGTRLTMQTTERATWWSDKSPSIEWWSDPPSDTVIMEEPDPLSRSILLEVAVLMVFYIGLSLKFE